MIDAPTESKVDTLSMEELPSLIPLARVFFEEGKLPGFFDADTFVTSWSLLLQNNLAHIVVIRKDGEIAGALGFAVTADINCAMMNSQELFWFVAPAHRKGRTAFMLIDAYEKKAKELGARSTTMAHLENLNQNLGVFYERRGYKRSETLYRKDL